MFSLPDSWVWDFWTVDDGERYHLFFLFASRALGDPDARHRRASVGHAVSTDLVRWERVADALVRGDSPAFDDLATWTGSIVPDPAGGWFMAYTGTTRTGTGLHQAIGAARSADLTTWEKLPGPIVQVDGPWYERAASDGSSWADTTCRDPWVMPREDGTGYDMLFTARAAAGPLGDRGVIGHAWSPDLRTWHLGPPRSEPGQGFSQAEVPQYVDLDGRRLLVFSCFGRDLADPRPGLGGVWAAPADGPTGPFHIAQARRLTDESLYVGKFVRRRDSPDWVFLAFLNDSPAGFVGAITDPLPVSVDDGGITVTGPGVVTGRPDRGTSPR
ncbi:glycosyl hydrolase family 32 [Propionicicella superfundia]|uniref:glycosyl hydrolase family 32 n=1 Tax=Propionicicella superfundia TaxID=348582 RepID=UPI0004141D6D|nr:glycosyl hydrolase family 32 [Propionicicella superfundia]